MIQDGVCVQRFEDKYAGQVVELWNECCKDEMLYMPFTLEDFNEKFINNPYFDYNGTFIVTLNEEVIGFANGIFKTDFLPGETFETLPGYITFVMVKKDKRGMGYGRQLVQRVEKYLKESGKSLVKIDFFNPINLQWIIPGTYYHDHPNSPGVDTKGNAYEFFKKLGYIERNVEVSMYMNLSDFFLSDNIKNKYDKLKEQGFTIEMYDESKHFGLDSFFDNLQNEDWRKCIKDNLKLEKSFPFLVAAKEGQVCGFAGPLEIEKSGRGRFCGIGVDPGFEGKGIGTVLFFLLCLNFKAIGTKFMSLFTGEKSNAKNIYSSAGFKVVRRWALFKKDL